MSQEVTFQDQETDESPLINYVNRLQKQMFIITTLFSDHAISFTYLAAPIRMLIYNLPPSGQEALKEEVARLCAFESNINEVPNKNEMEQIYMKVHNWAYTKLFQDAFKIKTRRKDLTELGSKLKT